MKRGVISSMRREQGTVSLAVVVALVLPLLLMLLPAPALSAEAQMLHDIDSSVCDASGQRGEHRQKQHDCCDCCILCPAGTLHAALSPDKAAGILPLQPVSTIGLRPAVRLTLSGGPSRSGRSARGPPSA